LMFEYYNLLNPWNEELSFFRLISNKAISRSYGYFKFSYFSFLRN
jgi:hypothetical protein